MEREHYFSIKIKTASFLQSFLNQQSNKITLNQWLVCTPRTKCATHKGVISPLIVMTAMQLPNNLAKVKLCCFVCSACTIKHLRDR